MASGSPRICSCSPSRVRPQLSIGNSIRKRLVLVEWRPILVSHAGRRPPWGGIPVTLCVGENLTSRLISAKRGTGRPWNGATGPVLCGGNRSSQLRRTHAWQP